MLSGAAVLIGLYLISLHHYLLFHTLSELFSIAIGISLFILAWNSRRILENNYLLFIGIAYLSVSLLTIFHTLSYKGMGIFVPDSANLPTQLWIASRFVQSISLVVAPYFLKRRLNGAATLLFFTVATVALLFSIHIWEIFPACYVEGSGLTPFKVFSEYVISFLMLVALVLLYNNRSYFDEIVLRYLAASILLAMGAELAFTFYLDVYGLSNLIGHFFELISFYLIYKAIIETGFAKPYRLLFRNILRQQEALQEEKERAQRYLDVAGVIIVVLNADQTVALINKKGCEVLEYEEKEIIGRNWFDTFVPEELRDSSKQVFMELVAGNAENAVFHENPILTGSGGERIIRWHNSVIRDQNGLVACTISSGNDITEQKRIEEALQKSEERYRGLFRAMTEGFALHEIICDENGEPCDYRFLDVNPAFERLTGLKRKQVVGKTKREILPDEGDHWHKTYGAVALTGWPVHFEDYSSALNRHYEVFAYCPAPRQFAVLFLDITERKHVEEQIKNMAKFPSENPSPVLRLDHDGIVLYANETSRSLLRHWRCEVGGHAPPFWRDLVCEALRCQSQKTVDLEYDKRVYSFILAPISDAGYVNVYGRDITERKQMEKALQESEMQLRAVVDNLPIGVWFTDGNGTILYGNAAGQQIWRGARYIGPEKFHEYKAWWADSGLPLNPDDWAVSRAVKKGETSLNEVLIIECFDGTRKTITNSAVPLRDPDGSIFGAVALNEDITERKRTEEELARQKLILDTLMEATSDHVYMWNRQKRYIYANPSALKTLGRTGEELLGRTWRELEMPVEAMEQFEADIERVFATGQPYRGELSFPLEDGLHRYDYIANPVFTLGSQTDAVAISARDITARKRIETELKERTAQLEHANRELESFSYSISHDLRAPLRAIDGYARMILKDHAHALDEDTRQKFGVIRDNARMMGQLIDDLLAFSRLGRKDMATSKIDMNNLIRDVWKELQIINPGRTMKLKIKDLPYCHGDQALIKQVCFNLLSNAVKFTKFKKVANIEVGGHPQENEIEYYVKDNGIGLDMAYYDKLFGVFQRLHSTHDFEGTGVGLAIVQRIIHRHGGQAWAEGKIDQGACFYFTLPIREVNERYDCN
ncbi:MAG: PAS domain S-box protein [Deltaproteobacteria bacterium]|nr:PAS domain S-box protein [Deltaproteobacteria bacterium]